MKPETKFYAKVKKYFKEFSLIRLENLSLPGTPDLLVYNNLVLDARDKNEKLYEGKRIRELVACGLELEPLCLGLDACRLKLHKLGA
jgi:hypothetical protein